MKRNLGLFLFVAALTLAILACGGGGESPTNPDSDVLFEDNFSDQSKNWDSVRIEGEGITDYEGETYQIRVDTANTDVWANPEGQSFTDAQVQVDATKQAGSTDNNDFGVICRYKDESNFYFFIISSDGYYGIGKVIGGIQELIGTDSMMPSDRIKIGDATNEIRGVCVGNKLSLYVNGQLVDEQEDASFTQGNVGLIAGTFDETYTDILFDNFKVMKP
jgi:hypothetical protein